jgi:hypothetical protein
MLAALQLTHIGEVLPNNRSRIAAESFLTAPPHNWERSSGAPLNFHRA